MANLSTLVNGSAEVVEIEGPRRIGPWRPSRHLLLRGGWHVRVRYRKLRPRRMDLPELGVRAVAERLWPVHISGTMRGLELSLSDGASWSFPARRRDDSTASFRWRFELWQRRKPSRCRDGRCLPPPRVLSLREPQGRARRAPLTPREAREILRECAAAYRASVR